MREAFRDSHPLIQIGILILAGFGAMFVLIMLIAIALLISGQPMEFITNPSALTDPNRIGILILKILQIAQSIGLFVAPYLIYRWLLHDGSYQLLQVRGRWSMLAVFSISMISALPLINFLAEWNSSLHLPGALSGVETWMRSTEAQAETLIRSFLAMDSIGDLLFNLVLIALLPAICEEVFFRGTVQPLLLRVTRGPHAAIWITAFIFSFFHMQFLGFFPRLLLGAVLGYAAHWSGTLMLPMMGHLLNNGIAVLATWYVGREVMSSEMETLGANEGEGSLVLLGTAVLIAGMTSIYFSHLRLQKKTTAA